MYLNKIKYWYLGNSITFTYICTYVHILNACYGIASYIHYVYYMAAIKMRILNVIEFTSLSYLKPSNFSGTLILAIFLRQGFRVFSF